MIKYEYDQLDSKGKVVLGVSLKEDYLNTTPKNIIGFQDDNTGTMLLWTLYYSDEGQVYGDQSMIVFKCELDGNKLTIT